MAELADAADSKSAVRKDVSRLLSGFQAQIKKALSAIAFKAFLFFRGWHRTTTAE